MLTSTFVTIVIVAILGIRSAYQVATRAVTMSSGNRQLFALFSAGIPVVWGALVGLIVGLVAGAVLVNFLSGLGVGLASGLIGLGVAYLRK